MAFLHRLLFGELPCPPQSSCNCTCVTPPVGAGSSPPPHHLLLPTSLTIMACTLGVFFFLGIVCTLARLYYLKRIESRRRNQAVLFDAQDDFADEEQGPAVHHPVWLINFVGLQQSVIDSITVCKYKRGDGLIEDTECTVCLTEFEEDENVRLLPKCSHAFHLPCIDTWLRSHKNCPLCRAPVAGNSSEMRPVSQQEPEQETRIEGSGTEIELDHPSRGEEDGAGAETDLGFGCRALSDLADDRRLIGVKPMRRSASMGSNSASMISLAVANAGKRNGNWEAKLKRQTFKNSGDMGGGAGRGSSSLYKLMRSASSGRVSMMRSYTSASSRNCRSQDSILPLSSA